ncbi:MAG: hypothetical protein ABI390_02280 [Daejeonella sp.]
MNFLKLKTGLFAAIIAVTAAFAASAFKPAEVKTSSVMYQFNSSQLNQARVSSAYSEITGTPPSCSGNNLPCIITVPDGQTLDQYLTSFGSDNALKNAATAKKN